MAQGGFLGDVLARISRSGRSWIATSTDESLIDQAKAILASDGEAALVVRSRDFLDAYRRADGRTRETFLRAAATELGPDRPALEAAIRRYAEAGDVPAARRLHRAAEPSSQELVRRLNRAPGATRELVALREDLLGLTSGDAALDTLDDDFKHLFGSWFNRGFLELKQIDWQTSAAVLEKIIRYEAVHAIRDWRDLRRRVAAPDRQLYAFFHPALPDDPLIFVEVALVAEIPSAIGPILAEERTPLDPDRARVAVFYSISNCQKGLRGISFGNFLIKTVVEELRHTFPSLDTFVTLSPLPKLREWAMEQGKSDGEPPAELECLAARYLIEAKSERGGPLDPVARFHLGNGARLERINLNADPSSRAEEQSWGVMANYLYDLKNIERNHEAFAATGEVAASTPVRRLIRERAQHG